MLDSASPHVPSPGQQAVAAWGDAWGHGAAAAPLVASQLVAHGPVPSAPAFACRSRIWTAFGELAQLGAVASVVAFVALGDWSPLALLAQVGTALLVVFAVALADRVAWHEAGVDAAPAVVVDVVQPAAQEMPAPVQVPLVGSHTVAPPVPLGFPTQLAADPVPGAMSAAHAAEASWATVT